MSDKPKLLPTLKLRANVDSETGELITVAITDDNDRPLPLDLADEERRSRLRRLQRSTINWSAIISWLTYLGFWWLIYECFKN